MEDKSDLILIGGVEKVSFPELGLAGVHARIDTGAKTSSIWASDITENNGRLSFKLFSDGYSKYTGEVVTTKQYGQKMIASSNGVAEKRYIIKALIVIGGRRVRATFTLADRSSQVYPVLIGRRVLSGKFIVNVKIGKRLTSEEKKKSKRLQDKLEE